MFETINLYLLCGETHGLHCVAVINVSYFPCTKLIWNYPTATAVLIQSYQITVAISDCSCQTKLKLSLYKDF